MECIIFTGLQASGKSTYYMQNFYKTHMRINLDMLKKRTRENIFLQASIDAHQRLVIDNTNPTIEDREKYIKLFKANHFKIIGYFFEATLEECLVRNAQRKGKENIPEIGLRSTFSKLVEPSFSEGYDMLYKVKIQNNQFVVTEIKNEI